jgi:hypothetical protein
MVFPDDCHDDIFREFALMCRREREANNETVPEPIITSYDEDKVPILSTLYSLIYIFHYIKVNINFNPDRHNEH